MAKLFFVNWIQSEFITKGSFEFLHTFANLQSMYKCTCIEWLLKVIEKLFEENHLPLIGEFSNTKSKSVEYVCRDRANGFCRLLYSGGSTMLNWNCRAQSPNLYSKFPKQSRLKCKHVFWLFSLPPSISL